MAVVYRYVRILTVGVVVFFCSPGIFHSQDSFPSTFRPRLWETSSGVVAVGVFAAAFEIKGFLVCKIWPMVEMKIGYTDDITVLLS